MKIPSDKAVLESIFKNYKKDFEKFESRQNKIYVPIDCKLIAKELKQNRILFLDGFTIT